MVNKNKMKALVAVVLMASFAAGCSGGKGSVGTVSPEENGQKAAFSSDPVTVKVAVSKNMFPEEDFKRYIADPVKKKYPNITVELLNTSQKGGSLTQLVAAGIVPDIVGLYPGNLVDLNEMGMTYNMEDLIKKYNFDTSRIVPEVIETVKVGSNQKFISGFAAYNSPFALYYDKDIFDKFAVKYPKDGMTWEDVRDLAVRLTRVQDGVQYRGVFVDYPYRAARQLALPYADFNTNKALLDTEQWKEMFQLWYSLYNIPGLSEGDFQKMDIGKNQNAFLDGTLAMFAYSSNTLDALLKKPNLNWDVVQYPSNKKAPGVGHRVDAPVLSITSQSKVKDAAFQVIDTVLSDEVQTEMVKYGRMTVLKSQKVKDQYAKGIPEFNGKNMIAFTKPKLPVMAEVRYLNEGTIDKITTSILQSVIDKKKDLNTAIRDGNEELNKHIQDQLSKK